MTPINTKSNRVMRGGSWSSYAWLCYEGTRLSKAPGYRDYFLVFCPVARFVRGKKR